MKESVVHEHEDIIRYAEPRLDEHEIDALKNLASKKWRDEDGKCRGGKVLAVRDGGLYATKYVGTVETRKTALEILPKVDLGGDADPGHEKTRAAFLEMLRDWRRWQEDARFPKASIRDLRRFEMKEAFFYLFLMNAFRLVQRGLARRYRTVENNLPYLRGRIRFPEHVRRNAANQARFFVGYDEFSADRPANRLIRKTLDLLAPRAQRPRNRQLLQQLRIAFAEIPPSANPQTDWELHSVDRSMRHYGQVMPWVELLLFRRGLATFSGKHRNRALLFRMEQVFEDFVAASFRRYRPPGYMVPKSRSLDLAKITTDKSEFQKVFRMRPDLTLSDRQGPAFVLDTKWKRLNPNNKKDRIKQPDLYQLFAYGKKYQVPSVALIYPQTEHFREPVRYRFDDSLSLWCFPFRVTKPEESVRELVRKLEQERRTLSAGA